MSALMPEPLDSTLATLKNAALSLPKEQRFDYLEWTILKADLIGREKNFSFPSLAIPNKISEYDYNRLLKDKQNIVNKYYKINSSGTEYIISTKKTDVQDDDKALIIHNTILRRCGVVWVDFGYNIGVEFGGRHPAVIIQNFRHSLLVAPLSSQHPTNEAINVTVNNVYGFEKKTRYVNVLRLRVVSILRVDLASNKGSVKGSVVDGIINMAQAKVFK